MTDERKLAGNVVNMPRIRRVAFKENDILQLNRPKQTVFIISGGCVRLERQVTTRTGVQTIKLCTYEQGEFILVGPDEEPCDRYVADISGQYIEMSRDDFEKFPRPAELVRSALFGSAKHDARLKATIADALTRGLRSERRPSPEDQTLALELKQTRGKLTEKDATIARLERELETARVDVFRALDQRDKAVANLTAVTSTLQACEGALSAARGDAETSRVAMRNAFEVFSAEGQKAALFWKSIEAIAQKRGIDHMDPDVVCCILGLTDAKPVDVDLRALEPAQEITRPTDPTPPPEGRLERSTLLGIPPSGGRGRVTHEREVQRVLDATSLVHDPDDDSSPPLSLTDPTRAPRPPKSQRTRSY